MKVVGGSGGAVNAGGWAKTACGVFAPMLKCWLPVYAGKFFKVNLSFAGQDAVRALFAAVIGSNAKSNDGKREVFMMTHPEDFSECGVGVVLCYIANQQRVMFHLHHMIENYTANILTVVK